MNNITLISVAGIDGAVSCIHVAFLLVVILSLILLWRIKTIYVPRLHPSSCTSRTILTLSLIALQVLILLKDILSSEPSTSSYVATLLTVAGTSACLVYSHTVGNVRPLSVTVASLLYWLTCSAFQVLHVAACYLRQPSLTADLDVSVHLETFILLIYLALLVMECVWLVRNVSDNTVLSLFVAVVNGSQISEILRNSERIRS